jgi:hypothetical protein
MKRADQVHVAEVCYEAARNSGVTMLRQNNGCATITLPTFKLRIGTSHCKFFRAYLRLSRPTIFMANTHSSVNLFRMPLVLLRIILEDVRTKAQSHPRHFLNL